MSDLNGGQVDFILNDANMRNGHIVNENQLILNLSEEEFKKMKELFPNGKLGIRNRSMMQTMLDILLGADSEEIISKRLRVLFSGLEKFRDGEKELPSTAAIGQMSKDIYQALLDHEDGLTDDEIQSVIEKRLKLGKEAKKNSIRYPRGLLHKAGVIDKSGGRRPTSRGGTANVWVVVDSSIKVADLPKTVIVNGK